MNLVPFIVAFLVALPDPAAIFVVLAALVALLDSLLGDLRRLVS